MASNPASKASGAETRRPHFAIKIDFDRGSPDPGRIFRAADALISAFEQIDRDLVEIIDSKIEPVLLLEDVDAGSLRILTRPPS